MRSRERCNRGLSAVPAYCLRQPIKQASEFSIWQSVVLGNEGSLGLTSETIIEKNYDQIIVYTDLTELKYEGENSVWQDGEIVEEQQLRRGDLCLDVKTGQILSAGPPDSIDPEIIYRNNTKLIEFWVALGDQHDEYWIEQPLGSNDQPIPWENFLTQRAMENLNATFLYCSQPPR